jgi:hypothetical protein
MRVLFGDCLYGRKYRKGQVDSVIAELKVLRGKNSFAFLSTTIWWRTAVTPWPCSTACGNGFQVALHAPIDFARDPELIRAAGDAGCLGMFVGFESLNRNSCAMGKNPT